MEEEEQGERTLGMVSGEASVDVCGESTTAGEYEWAKDLLDEANNLGCPL